MSQEPFLNFNAYHGKLYLRQPRYGSPSTAAGSRFAAARSERQSKAVVFANDVGAETAGIRWMNVSTVFGAGNKATGGRLEYPS